MHFDCPKVISCFFPKCPFLFSSVYPSIHPLIYSSFRCFPVPSSIPLLFFLLLSSFFFSVFHPSIQPSVLFGFALSSLPSVAVKCLIIYKTITKKQNHPSIQTNYHSSINSFIRCWFFFSSLFFVNVLFLLQNSSPVLIMIHSLKYLIHVPRNHSCIPSFIDKKLSTSPHANKNERKEVPPSTRKEKEGKESKNTREQNNDFLLHRSSCFMHAVAASR